MPTEVKVKLYEPTSREVDEILKMHNDNFKTQQKKQYYSTLVTTAMNPFWLAVNVDNDELLGFIATRIDYEKSLMNIVSITERRDVEGVLSLLLRKVIKDAKVIKVAEINTQCRASSKEIREALKKVGFTESKNGTFKDGEEKLQYQLKMKKGKHPSLMVRKELISNHCPLLKKDTIKSGMPNHPMLVKLRQCTTSSWRRKEMRVILEIS